MIASRKYGFIYLKTRKTAGTSVELALSPHCGPDDILTTFGSTTWDSERAKLGGWPRNFSRDPMFELRLREALGRGDRAETKKLKRENSPYGCGTHMRALEVKKWVGDEFWNSALKFTTVRHPYEAALSLAHQTYRGPPDDARRFSGHLDKTIAQGKYIIWYIICIRGKPVVDECIRHDRLEEELRAVLQRVGFPDIGPLPRARDRSQPGRGKASEVLSLEQKRAIAEKAASEFSFFGWPE